MLRQLIGARSGAVVRSELIATAGESPAALSEVTMSTTPAAQEQRVTVIIKSLLRGVIVPRFEAHTAFTLTKRDNGSSGMIRSADSAIDSMIHEKARCRATTVPEAGRVLLRRVTDRKSGGENLRHFMRPRQAFASAQRKRRPTENRCDVASYLPG